eukprot:CAMPEP_0181227840 /NCGR_PEP_ID=MMETSP1096-20121128/33010_1 /TAXON_ID=156174 ORGANISM="Chrysochromulina ericina, Strain CCMP281" /NCGR_SAMPLE_ID=MMETSP1096 /ASSEMBLY_ACC=CAM_ASM_000453 /LENGTH=69 /DNA_ID=CAMNT_0023321287 /DNA_START=557 /DNA_END=766 /DNA_ORIENTATION=+
MEQDDDDVHDIDLACVRLAWPWACPFVCCCGAFVMAALRADPHVAPYSRARMTRIPQYFYTFSYDPSGQ